VNLVPFQDIELRDLVHTLRFFRGTPIENANSKTLEQNFAKGEEVMKRPFRIIPKAQREQPETKSENGPRRDSNQWSKAVRSWVAEFREHSNRSVPAFNQVFSKQRLS